MKIDNKPRDFSYITFKNNQPLQITGTMKHRSRPNSAQHNSLSKEPNQCIVLAGLPLAQIVGNYKDLKSVIPIDLCSTKRKQSIRTFQKQKNVSASGVALLMLKSRLDRDHPEKRHLTSGYCCTAGPEEAFIYKQKRHYDNKRSESASKDPERAEPRKHCKTLNQKLRNDLYSKIELKESAVGNTVKFSSRSMFKEGADLGFDKEKTRGVSGPKKRELMGEYSQPVASNQKVYRNDWRNSSFQLGW